MLNSILKFIHSIDIITVSSSFKCRIKCTTKYITYNSTSSVVYKRSPTYAVFTNAGPTYGIFSVQKFALVEVVPLMSILKKH